MLKKLSSYILVLGIGAAIGTYFDAKHTIEEKVVFKDRTRTVIKEVITEKPDGTKITQRETNETTKVDKTQARKESRPVKKEWGVGVQYDLFRPEPIVTVNVHRRVFGSLYGGVYGRTDGTVGIGLTFFF